MTARRTGNTLLRFGVALVSVLIFFVGGEIVVRQLDLIDRLNAYPRRLYIPTEHPDLPYRLRPGFRTTHTGRPLSVRVNRHGLRGAEIDDEPAPGVHRLMVLGDSVVYGFALPEASSFPVQLGSTLAETCDQPIEVLSAAAAGWNTLAEAAFLEHYGLALRPATVVLGISLNDFGPTPFLTSRGVLTTKARGDTAGAWLGDQSELYVLLRFLASRLGESPEPAAPRAEVEAAARPAQPAVDRKNARKRKKDDGRRRLDRRIRARHKKFYADPNGDGWADVRLGLQRIRDLTARDDVDLVVLLFPESFQFGRRPDRRPQGAWLGLCEELGLDCVDLWATFAKGGADPGGELFSDVQHPNAAGLALAAKASADVLAERWAQRGDPTCESSPLAANDRRP